MATTSTPGVMHPAITLSSRVLRPSGVRIFNFVIVYNSTGWWRRGKWREMAAKWVVGGVKMRFLEWTLVGAIFVEQMESFKSASGKC